MRLCCKRHRERSSFARLNRTQLLRSMGLARRPGLPNLRRRSRHHAAAPDTAGSRALHAHHTRGTKGGEGHAPDGARNRRRRGTAALGGGRYAGSGRHGQRGAADGRLCARPRIAVPRGAHLDRFRRRNSHAMHRARWAAANQCDRARRYRIFCVGLQDFHQSSYVVLTAAALRCRPAPMDPLDDRRPALRADRR